MGKSLRRKIFFSHWFIFFPLEWLESGERRADILLLCRCLPTFPTTEKISPGRVLESSPIARNKDSATCWRCWVGLSIKLSSHMTQIRFHCVAHRYHNSVSYLKSPQGAFEAQLFLIIPESTSQSRRNPTSTWQEMSTCRRDQSPATEPAEPSWGLAIPLFHGEDYLIQKQILNVGRRKTFKAPVAVGAATGMRWLVPFLKGRDTWDAQSPVTPWLLDPFQIHTDTQQLENGWTWFLYLVRYQSFNHPYTSGGNQNYVATQLLKSFYII